MAPIQQFHVTGLNLESYSRAAVMTASLLFGGAETTTALAQETMPVVERAPRSELRAQAIELDLRLRTVRIDTLWNEATDEKKRAVIVSAVKRDIETVDALAERSLGKVPDIGGVTYAAQCERLNGVLDSFSRNGTLTGEEALELNRARVFFKGLIRMIPEDPSAPLGAPARAGAALSSMTTPVESTEIVIAAPSADVCAALLALGSRERMELARSTIGSEETTVQSMEERREFRGLELALLIQVLRRMELKPGERVELELQFHQTLERRAIPGVPGGERIVICTDMVNREATLNKSLQLSAYSTRLECGPADEPGKTKLRILGKMELHAPRPVSPFYFVGAQAICEGKIQATCEGALKRAASLFAEIGTAAATAAAEDPKP